MYFHLDKVGPVVESTVTVRLNAAGDGFVYDAAGRALDAMSGLGGEVLLNPPDDKTYPGPFWPQGPPSVEFAFPGLSQSARFMAFDRAGWPGIYNLSIAAFTEELSLSNTYGMTETGAAGQAGVILRNANLTVSGYLPELPPEYTLLNQPEGMKMALWAESEELAAEYKSNVDLIYGYSRTTARKLFEIFGQAGGESATFNLAMRPLMRLRLQPTANTNTVRYRYQYDEGEYEGEFPPGYFTPRAWSRAAVAYANLGSMEHFYQWMPTGEAHFLQAGRAFVIIRNVTKAGSVIIETARRTLVQPGYKPPGDDVIYEIKTTAEADGPIEVGIDFYESNHDQPQCDSPKIVHCREGEAGCVLLSNTTSNGFTARAEVYDLSPFGVMVPVSDSTPPRTRLELIGAEEILDGRLWVTTETYVDMTATDYAEKGDISGVARLYKVTI